MLAAAFALLLRRWREGPAVAFCTPLTQRDVAGAPRLIGSFYNNVLVSIEVDADISAAALIERTRRAAFEAFTYGEVPLRVVRSLFASGSAEPSSLDVRFQLHENPSDIHLPGVRMHRLRMHQYKGETFSIRATETSGGGLDLEFTCRPDLPSRIGNEVLPAYRRIVQSFIRDPYGPIDLGPNAGGSARPGQFARSSTAHSHDATRQ